MSRRPAARRRPPGAPPGRPRSLAAVTVLLLLGSGAAADPAPAWTGVYVADGGRATAALRAVGDSVWLFERQLVALRPVARGTGFVLEPGGALLVAPGRGQRTWHLKVGKEDRTQADDPFLRRMLEHLDGTRPFLHLDLHGRPDAGTFVVKDGLTAELRLGEGPCRPGLLRPDPTRNGEVAAALAPPQPRRGETASRTFLLLGLDVPGCPVAVDPGRPPGLHGLLAGLILFADEDGAVVGAQLIGYMMSELFVAREATPAQTRRLLEANREELGHQAE